jgi:hypothetical protein
MIFQLLFLYSISFCLCIELELPEFDSFWFGATRDYLEQQLQAFVAIPASRSNILYTTQLYVAPLLRYAELSRNEMLLNDLSALFSIAFQNNSLADPTTNVLDKSQFLFSTSNLIYALSKLDSLNGVDNGEKLINNAAAYIWNTFYKEYLIGNIDKVMKMRMRMKLN